ncbi:hypothetical protein MVLG_01733 [Microbotryum lychnidis-dioicae p1A1 Lamole]|uniref:Ribosomal protein S11 n=1 Tax=Microbotryum lychnidis-dioicae (strain p1A1 Lamole / MvSl-1064) TaxID=683840 RepID=U5H306_USTV1|nr:hypothetical protein MVLG_01733 [Microbotryum lychnidis-dioicae p1A1 Lamole]|eukprot:KDE08032.1 hypothetical protein MVLG_01733 [Microbotryum lychnidis-dioicae p1A1 Lamole]
MLAPSSRIVGRLGLPMTRFVSHSSASTSAATAPSLPGTSSDSSPLPAAFRAAAQTPGFSSSNSTPSSSSTNAPFNFRSSQSNPSYRPLPTLRGQRAPMHKYRLSVYSTRNNTILTLTTKIGTTASSSSSGPSTYFEESSVQAMADTAMMTDSVVAWVSAGSAGYKGASRGTYDAAVEVSIKMFNKIRQLVDPVNAVDAGMRKKNAWPQPTELEVVWNGFGQGREAVFRTLIAGNGDQVRELVNRVTDATPLKVGGTRPKKRRVI